MPVRPTAIHRLIQAMPKAELHLHLDGCLRPLTALELAAERHLAAPGEWTGMFDALVAPDGPSSQEELLRAFDLPIALMQDEDALARITDDLIADKAADRVRYLEIKWAPAVHCAGGLSLDDVIVAVATAAAAAAQRHGVTATLTVVAMRAHDPAFNVEVAEAAVRHHALGVTGFDLAGYELRDPDVLRHADAFTVARAGGLGCTVHAGEVADDADLVRNALALDPDRIAHGATAIHDDELCATLIERGLTLDICPSSNLQAGTVQRFADHPLPQLVRRGVPVTINTDDTTISNVTLSEELIACHDELGLTVGEIWGCTRQALDVAFVDHEQRVALVEEFERWSPVVAGADDGRGVDRR
jgi:adenosine deaminase